MPRILPVLLATLLFTSAPAFADGDEHIFTGEGIRLTLTDQTVVGTDRNGPTEQVFKADGETLYTAGGRTTTGRWEIRGNKYCSQWPPSESWACYTVKDGGRIIAFVSENGTRTEVSIKPKAVE